MVGIKRIRWPFPMLITILVGTVIKNKKKSPFRIQWCWFCIPFMIPKYKLAQTSKTLTYKQQISGYIISNIILSIDQLIFSSNRYGSIKIHKILVIAIIEIYSKLKFFGLKNSLVRTLCPWPISLFRHFLKV